MLCQNQLLRKGTKITTGKNYDYHSVKNVRILSFSGLNGGKYGHFSRSVYLNKNMILELN